jgi:hypothetical protein
MILLHRSIIICLMAAAMNAATASKTQDDITCLTAESCNSKRMEMELTGGFYTSDDYPTKGCYYKNGNVFFSPGTQEEMSTSDLPGLRVRIWCNDNEAMGESKVGETKTLDNDDTGVIIKTSASNDVLGPTGGFVDIEQNEIEMRSRGSSVSSSGVGITGITTSINFLIAASLVGLTTFLVY